MKINLYTSHPSAFISSTFADLAQERDAVANVLRESNLNINALDVKPASNSSSRKEILTGIKESDFIILIVGERYGSVIPKMTLSKKLSITKWEYQIAAKSQKKHVLVYFKRVESKDPAYYDDHTSPDYKLKRKMLDEFKSELINRHNPKYFTTPEELAGEVKRAIIPTYRAGVVSLINLNKTIKNELELLRLENQRLKTTTSATEQNSENNILLHGLTRSQPKGLLAGLDGNMSSENRQIGLGNGLLGYALNRDKKK